MNKEDEEKNTTGQPPRLKAISQSAGLLFQGRFGGLRHARAVSTAATETRERTWSVTKPRVKLTPPLLYLAAGALLSITICSHNETHTYIDAGPGAVIQVVNGEMGQ